MAKSIKPLLAAALLLFMCACSAELSLPTEPDAGISAVPASSPSAARTSSPIAPEASSPIASGSATETEGPGVVETPVDLQATVDQIRRALQAPDAKSMAPLFVEPVWLAAGPVGDEGKSISRSEALAWLGERWGSTRTVVSDDYVEHFVLLEIETAGWSALPPVQGGTVLFHMHRYNTQGEEDPVQGAWRIDAIIYQ